MKKGETDTHTYTHRIKLKIVFEKITEIDKLLARLMKKREKTQTVNIRNERDVTTTDATDIQKIVSEHHEQFCQ